MHGKVVINDKGACSINLSNGESFDIDCKDLPDELKLGGDIELAFVPAGETADASQANKLLNYLLRID